VNQNFISDPSGQPAGLAVDGTYIYWGGEGVVPEPTTGLLMMAGVLGLAAARRIKT
jgi:hypothetical protein